MKRNQNFSQLSPHYLFPEINLRKKKFLAKEPNAKLISLGIGDTILPLPSEIAMALAQAGKNFGEIDGYKGYGPEQGILELRKKIGERLYGNRISWNDIFISDGAKCDIGRLQLLFGANLTVGIPDPAYPVYQDGTLLHGAKKIEKLPCQPQNDFFPSLKKCDLLYFCSPNNPTGKAATFDELERLVQFALKEGTIILFDAAYASYIQDKRIPKSIYEVEGAKKVAIEIGSFSKMAGFSGIRLGWTIVPEDLLYANGESIQKDWNRLITTLFNGASLLSQQGGCAVLDHLSSVQKQIEFYLENAHLLRKALSQKFEVYGGENAPYLWVKHKSTDSWQAFQEFLENYQIVTSPGIGFGETGDAFLRFSAFGARDTILEASQRLNP